MNDKIKCELIGKPLGHSYSPQIHSLIGSYSYVLHELDENEIGDYLGKRDFDGINVTIPYKKTVMPYLDRISEEALKIGSVNTVVHEKDGSLSGYNTDYFGFSYMLKRVGISLENRKVVILGSGGASMTARYAASAEGARETVVISRSGENNYGNISLHRDADIIINTTPVGMFPGNGLSPLSLTVFDNPESVVDMIYNPSKTALILEAERLGVPHITSGLPMLSAQAVRAAEYFTGTSFGNGLCEKIIASMEARMKNIILTGMPGCGKSTTGKALASVLKRDFYDTDELTAQRCGMGIPDIFRLHGEEYFRNAETDVLRDVTKLSGAVIATGGGCVIREENRDLMRQNGTVVYITRPNDELETSGRPLSLSRNVDELYKERHEYYEKADITVPLLSTAEDTALEIINIINI